MNHAVRRATIKDSHRIWEIRNDPANRQFMYNPEPISFNDHQRWFTNYLKTKRGIFAVLTGNKKILGYIRFNYTSNKTCDISIAVDSHHKGKGFGSILLTQALKKLEPDLKHYEIHAEVKLDNPASRRLFEKNRFNLKKTTEKNFLFTYRYPKTIVIATNHDWGIRASQIPGRYRIIFITKKSELTFERLASLNPRYIFFPHWSWLIPAEIFERFECVVFHMTDLPYGRGGTPLQNLIWRGHTSTKISAIRVIAGLDAGDIYLKKSLVLTGRAQDIYERANKIIITMINHIIKKQSKLVPQRGKVVIFPRRKPEESRLPQNISTKKMYDFIRMLDAPGYPKAFLEHGGFRIEFTNAKLKGNKLTANIELYEKK